ncbi:ATP-binding cassette domain-containing protein [Candidatus Gracilibacteria bacterium]|nr:ATP-binding cassette domain-containing protein [Candidatus Gracilibacteria bacterium]
MNLEIKKGEWVFLVGPSGSGKTTILQSIFGNLAPSRGSFINDQGRDIYQFSSSELRAYQRTGGMIFQDYKLISYKTVSENIAYAMEICGYAHETIEPRTNELLDLVGMIHKKNAFPPKLSGGESQRVAIARALIHEPTMILADEPTGSLDHKNVNIIMDLLLTIHKQGTTIVFATHDQKLLSTVDARVIDVTQFH